MVAAPTRRDIPLTNDKPRHAALSRRGVEAVDWYRKTLELQLDLDKARFEWQKAVDEMDDSDAQAYYTRTSEIHEELLPDTPETAEGDSGAQAV